jgi:signal transduction histidine kinase
VHRWFDVRTRDVRWVDGRDVRLLIATDITERKATEDIVRQQQDKVQLTSRLMTMGEMASSLAHELNQPLTAISNQPGTVSRARTGELFSELPAGKSGQAQRAATSFAHPRVRQTLGAAAPSTPVARIVEDTIGFADIEAAKTQSPPRSADRRPMSTPSFEQLLLNPLKNAIDAMRMPQRASGGPPRRRHGGIRGHRPRGGSSRSGKLCSSHSSARSQAWEWASTSAGRSSSFTTAGLQ